MEQALFEKHYTSYSKILRAVGLMPFDRTMLAIVQRSAYLLLLCYCLYVQSVNLVHVEKTLANIVWMLSFVCAITLFGLRYSSFLICRSMVKDVFTRIGNDIESVKDPVEADIFAKYTKQSEYLLMGYLGLAYFLSIYAFTVLIIPTLLRSHWQLRFLKLFGYLYTERSLQTDIMSIALTAVTVMGIFSIVGTESAISVYTSYLCGLFEIASYRMDLAIQHSKKTDSVLINVQPALDMQRKAISTLSKLERDQAISYLIAIGAVIFSFAVALFRLLLVFKHYFSINELIFSGGSVSLQFLVMFLNNYCGQNLKDSGGTIFKTVVQSSWYSIPVKSQKILLFVTMRSIETVECNLAGLYRLSFEGFAIMMNSSFSYFTLLCSTQ
ncbi:uncharacterized protein LOC143355234 isoform X1 [Halictus rubicundus]|uniref:uncharacterized protein LOC143355234 isoform X1 n=1 Tax=Halictus rubicundus TaxID=77578 RepID=UPI0040360451